MDRISGPRSSEAVSRFKDGLSEYLTADGVSRLLEAIDSEAVLEEAMADDVPTEEVARLTGRVLGRVVAKEATSYLPLGQVIEAAVGRKAGEKIGEGAVALVIEYGSTAAIVARVSSVRDRIDRGDEAESAGRFGVRERANAVRDRVPGFGDDDPWETESATTVPITEDANGD